MIRIGELRDRRPASTHGVGLGLAIFLAATIGTAQAPGAPTERSAEVAAGQRDTSATGAPQYGGPAKTDHSLDGEEAAGEGGGTQPAEATIPRSQWWDGPYTFFDQSGQEIAHAALIGRPNTDQIPGDQGKVLLWRTATPGLGFWLWDPSAPTSVVAAAPPTNTDGMDNLFCAGHAWNKDGNLVIAGGNYNDGNDPPTCDDPDIEPNWTWMFFPLTTPQRFVQMGDMLTLPTVPQTPPKVDQDFGHYYPTVIQLNNGWMLSAGGTDAPCNALPLVLARGSSGNGEPSDARGWWPDQRAG